MQLLEQRGQALLAAASASARAGNRLPLAAFLGLVEDEGELAAVPSQNSWKRASSKRCCAALVTGCVPEAVELCISANRFDDAFAVAAVNTDLSSALALSWSSAWPRPCSPLQEVPDAVALGTSAPLLPTIQCRSRTGKRPLL